MLYYLRGICPGHVLAVLGRRVLVRLCAVPSFLFGFLQAGIDKVYPRPDYL